MKMRFPVLTWILGATFFAVAAQADTLFPLTENSPRVAAGYVSVSYNSTTGAFSASGYTSAYTLPAQATQNTAAIIADSFDLKAVISNSGVASSAQLTVKGVLQNGNLSTPLTLFSDNNLLKFGSGPDDVFEFLFTKGTGAFESASNPFPYTGVYIALPNTLANAPSGDPEFNQNFSAGSMNSGFGPGIADVFATPLPSSIAGASVLIALLGIARPVRRLRCCL